MTDKALIKKIKNILEKQYYKNEYYKKELSEYYISTKTKNLEYLYDYDDENYQEDVDEKYILNNILQSCNDYLNNNTNTIDMDVLNLYYNYYTARKQKPKTMKKQINEILNSNILFEIKPKLYEEYDCEGNITRTELHFIINGYSFVITYRQDFEIYIAFYDNIEACISTDGFMVDKSSFNPIHFYKLTKLYFNFLR